jgi:hypothetical protein
MTATNITFVVYPHRNGYAVAAIDAEGAPTMFVEGTWRRTREECEQLISGNPHVHPLFQPILTMFTGGL